MTARSVTFTHAITRAPADTAVDGLRAVDTGAPDLARLRRRLHLSEPGHCACEGYEGSEGRYSLFAP